MPSFLVRVELLDAGNKDYDLLDRDMKKRGFSKFIPDDQGQYFTMPTGEYYFRGHKTVGYLCEMGQYAAAALGKKARILAAELTAIALDLELLDARNKPQK